MYPWTLPVGLNVFGVMEERTVCITDLGSCSVVCLDVVGVGAENLAPTCANHLCRHFIGEGRRIFEILEILFNAGKTECFTSWI